MKNKLPAGTKAVYGDGPGSIKSFSENAGYGASLKSGPMVSHPGPGNGSGTIPKGETLKASHVRKGTA